MTLAALAAVAFAQAIPHSAGRIRRPAHETDSQPVELHRSPAGTRIGAAVLRLMRAGKVVRLASTVGTVTGNGRTRYVANGTTFRPLGRVPLPPRVLMRTWVVVDLDTDAVLGEHEARAWRPPASTIKLLTALTAVRVLAPTTAHQVTAFEAGQPCACAGLQVGASYTVESLLKGMLLPSGNDAAEALADTYPGGRGAFTDAMNQTARALGATDTKVDNASGLTVSGEHSSALDLVVLLRAALENPILTSVLRMPAARIASVRGRYGHQVWRTTNYPNAYPGSLGKSGFTTPAGNTLVVASRLHGHLIAVATMGAPFGYSTLETRALTVWAGTQLAHLKPVDILPGR